MENSTLFLEDNKGKSLGTTDGIPASLLKEGFIIVKGEQKYEVTKWFFTLEDEGEADANENKGGTGPKLKVILREIKLPWFARLKQDSQVFVGYLLVLRQSGFED